MIHGARRRLGSAARPHARSATAASSCGLGDSRKRQDKGAGHDRGRAEDQVARVVRVDHQVASRSDSDVCVGCRARHWLPTTFRRPDHAPWLDASPCSIAVRASVRRPSRDLSECLRQLPRSLGFRSEAEAVLLLGPGGSVWVSDNDRLVRVLTGDPSDDVVAVVGTNHALWVDHPGRPGWRDLGGWLLGPPSVVSVAGITYYFAEGRDHEVWVRTDQLWWARAAATTSECHQPNAAHIGERLLLICASDKAYTFGGPYGDRLYIGVGVLVASRLPFVPSFGWGPGTELNSGENITGPAQDIDDQLDNVVAYQSTTALAQMSYEAGSGSTIPADCASAPTVATAGLYHYLACDSVHHQLLYATRTDGNYPWSAMRPVSTGYLNGPVGLAAQPNGTMNAYVQGGAAAGGAVYVINISPTSHGSWSLLGGTVIGGASAIGG